MKTMSKITEMYDNHKINGDDVFEIDVLKIVRIFKAHQRALNDKLALEARIASFEVVERKERVIYG